VRVVIAKVVIKRELVDQPLGTDPEEPPTGAATSAVVEEPAGEATEEDEAMTASTPQPKATARPKTIEGQFEDFNVWEFLFIALGVFLAYELARGTGLAQPSTPTPEAG